jgi:hypothetical protein
VRFWVQMRLPCFAKKKRAGDKQPRSLSSAAAMDMRPRRASCLVRRGEVAGDDAVVLEVAALGRGVGAELHLADAVDRLDRDTALLTIVEVLLP